MKFETIARYLEGIPHTSPQKGKIFYDFILNNKLHECLELGFCHGVSSCYIAAALHELGYGTLTTVDLEVSQQLNPTIETLLDKTGLSDFVNVVREKTGYNWFLKQKIEESTRNGNCEPLYDFCFVDGAKNWTIDGFAFFLVDKLLHQNGWLVFDDYDWTYAGIEAKTGKKVSDGINHCELSQAELEQPHIQAIFNHLVMPHPDYSNFRIIDDQLAIAQKVRSNSKMLQVVTNVSFKYKLVSSLRNLRHRSA